MRQGNAPLVVDGHLLSEINNLVPRNIEYKTGDVVEFQRDKGAGWTTSIGTLGERDIEHDRWTVEYLEGASNWRGRAPLPGIPDICIIGLRKEDVKKADKGMLGQKAIDERGVACGTVVSVNPTTGFLLLRDGDAQHRSVHILDGDVTHKSCNLSPN